MPSNKQELLPPDDPLRFKIKDVLTFRGGKEIYFYQMHSINDGLIDGKPYLFERANFSIDYNSLIKVYGSVLGTPRDIQINPDEFDQPVIMFLAKILLDPDLLGQSIIDFTYKSIKMSIGKYEGPLNKSTLSGIINNSRDSISQPQSITKIVNKAIKESIEGPNSRLLSAPIKRLITKALIYVTQDQDGPEVPFSFHGLDYEYFGKPMYSRT